MSDRPTYITRAERDGDWWMITIDNVPGAFSQTRRLDQIEEWARDAIALVLDVDPDSFDLEIEPRLDDNLDLLVTEYRDLHEQLGALQLATADAILRFVRQARGAGALAQRDVAWLTDLSHQRIAQIEARAAESNNRSGAKR